MAMVVLVDPVMLAVPIPETVTDDAFLSYVNRLRQWSESLISDHKSFLISEACYSALWDADCYPTIENLSALWKYLGEEQISVQDLYRVCKGPLSNTPYLEDRIPGLREVEVYEETVQVRPDLTKRLMHQLASGLKLTLGRVAYAKTASTHTIAESLRLLTSPIDDSILVFIDAHVETNSGTSILKAEVPLVVEPDQLREMIVVDSWSGLLQVMTQSFCNLTFSPTLSDYLKDQPFEAALSTSIISLLEILDTLKSCFNEQGKRTHRGHVIMQNFFSGDNAKFSDESDTNKRRFLSALTFRGPDDSPVFCPFHGKIKHREFRIHFTWPVTADKPLYIAYIGPKITKH